MKAVHLSRIGGGAVVGSLLGILLHFVFGISLFPAAPRRMPAPAGTSQEPPPGVLEKERLAAAHLKRGDDLSRKIAAAEQECADLKKRIAAVPSRPPENSREAKIRKFGGLMVRMIKVGALRNTRQGSNVEIKPETMAEVQRLVGEIFALSGELGINLQDQSSVFKNPEIVSGIFEGMLSECGVVADEAELAEWRSGLSARIAAPPQPSTGLSNVLLSMAIQEEFLDRFGMKLMERDPAVASMLGNVGASNSVSVAEATVAVAAALFLEDVVKTARLNDAQTAAVRPSLEAWASQYAQLLSDARTKYGDAVVDGLFRGEAVGKTAEEKVTYLRNRVKLQSQILQLQFRTLETVSSQVDSEAAKRLLKLERAYYFNRLKP